MKPNMLKVLTVTLVTILFTSVVLPGIIPARAGAESSMEVISAEEACVPGRGWMWVSGQAEPEVASRVQQELEQRGIKTVVEARNYGERDSCGNYHAQGIDFKITLKETRSNPSLLDEEILPILTKHGKPNVGNIKLFSPQGNLISTNSSNKLSTSNQMETNALGVESLPADAITKQVYVIVYDPLLSNGQKLSQHLGWNDQATITQQTLDLFNQASNGKMNYVVANTTIVTSGWPELIDGFTYTEQEYLAVIANPNLHHEPTGVNYNKIVNDPQFDICGKVNRGEIDEVWIYNGPWFGFFESTLVGPGAYMYNSPPVGGTHNCTKLLPIMGPSPERSVNEAVHNFGHRMEATMTKAYGSWQQNNTSHSWNKFGLVKAQSPNYSYSGCGSTHYPPNGTSDYNYTNPTSVLSNCSDFANYPNLSDPLPVAQPVSCSAWGCFELNYYKYWFGHLPANTGCGPDNAANDWWKYFASPAYALYPSHACQADMHFISGNAGAGGATLSYNDGGPKTVTADVSGNYFLLVSNHWSGTVTPSRASYTFTPASKSYSDVQSDLYGQDYTAERGIFYVNIATGDNGNSCTAIATPCRNIQEAINKAGEGDKIYVASGTYLFSSNGSPNVVIINKNLTLSGGWNSDFTSQNGSSTIDGANVNNGILAISGTVIVENFIVQNSTSHNSGAIYIVNGNFTLRKSTLRNNTAAVNGAGIFLDNGVLNVINSTISGNTAGGSGGGIYASLNSGTSVTIQNSTIAYNQASTGGGISRTNGTYNITNTIIANNTSSSSSPDCSGTIAVANFNIIENTVGCTISSGSNNLNVDPQLDSNLTGAMLVHLPLAGSPAINAGTISGCPSTDQIGTARPQGSSCDIGSIENLIGTSTPTFTPTATQTPTAGPTPVTNCDQITPGPITISGNSMSMHITNPLTVPIQIQDVFVVWNDDRGHLVGSDKSLILQSASLSGTVFWTGNISNQSTYTIVASPNIPPASTVILSFSFHQSYDIFDGTEQIVINLATNGCQSFPIISNSIATNTPTFTPTPVVYTLVLQPDAATGMDSYIYSGSKTSNFGTAAEMGIGEDNNTNNRTARSLIKFDLSSIPANATITSATLSLWTNADLSSNDRAIHVYRLKVPFHETQATWSRPAAGINWQTAGASGANDRESNDIGSVTILNNEALNLEKQILLTPSKLQEMVNGTFANNGFIIVAETEQNDRFNYKSSDSNDSGQRPKLVIQFTVSAVTPTLTPTLTNTPTFTPSVTPTATQTPTMSLTPSLTPTLTISPTLTLTPTATPSQTFTPSITTTVSVTPSLTPTPSFTPSPTWTASATPSQTATFTPTATWTPTATPTWTASPTPSRTPTITATSSLGFPSTTVLDNFNRLNGAPGKNWTGATAGYSIVSNSLDVGTGDALFWRVFSYGASQEVFVTLSTIDTAGSELDLLLKSQSSTTWSSGVIKVLYNPIAQTVQVWTYSSVQGWVQRGTDIPVTLANGDQFGARAKSNGVVEIYRNGVLLGSRDASGWTYSANGGYIGLWFMNAGNALLDDFGGGTILP